MKKTTWSASVLLSTLLLGCGGGSTSEEGPEGTVGFSGSIEGLVGAITVNLNGSPQVFTTNGDFVLDTRIETGSNFTISVSDTLDGLTCTVSNGSGIAEQSQTNVLISCSGLETRAYSINALDFKYQSPSSVLSTSLHLVDRKTGDAIDDLTADNFSDYLTILENGLPVSDKESFIEVDNVTDLNTNYTTVFAIDVSASIEPADLELVKGGIKSIIADESGQSLLLDNQKVSILTFDGDVEFVVENSQDINAINTAIDGITVGGNSTNLYGAIQAAASSWENQVSLENISYGSMILFTDGNDSSFLVSKEQALEASIGKDLYFITLGADTDRAILEEFTDSDNIFELDNIASVGRYLSDALAHVKSYENGLYVIGYATPKRAGTHQLTFETNDDYTCQTPASQNEQLEMSNTGNLQSCVDSVEYEFNANNFTDVEPLLDVIGVSNTVSPTAQWQVKLRWSNDTPRYQWSTTLCMGDITPSIKSDVITFTRNIEDLSIIRVDVTETSTGLNQRKFLFMAKDKEELESNRIFRGGDCN